MGAKKAKQTEAEKISASMGLYKATDAAAKMDIINPALEKVADTDIGSTFKGVGNADVFQNLEAPTYSGAVTGNAFDFSSILSKVQGDSFKKGALFSDKSSSDVISRQLNKEGDASNIFTKLGNIGTNENITKTRASNAYRNKLIAGGTSILGSGISSYVDRKAGGGSLFQTNVNAEKMRRGARDASGNLYDLDLKNPWQRLMT
tara:strand:+ start:414 stop:1025 length:612 start_codon:yes stop_codon:yes gene_type:complete